jgi:iron complex transport system permease protein
MMNVAVAPLVRRAVGARQGWRLYAPWRWVAGLVVLLALAVAASLVSGAVWISPLRWGDLLWQTGASDASMEARVMGSLRVPRVLMGLVVGAALASCGAAMQSLFRNPLADPGLLGVSSGAAVGVVTWMVVSPDAWQRGAMASWWMAGAGFTGGILATLAVIRLASWGGPLAMGRMLLAGIALNALAGAWIGLMVYVSDDAQLRSLTLWSMGHLGASSWAVLAVLSPIVLVGLALLATQARALHLMSLGEGDALCLGVRPSRVRLGVVAIVSAVVGAAVAFTGVIGFVGMVVPHAMRLAGGPDMRSLLVLAPLAGALLLLSADTVARTAVMPAEMPVGIVTALLGAPCFLWLLRRQSTQEAV